MYSTNKQIEIMATYKLHLAGTSKTKELGQSLPICGKISFGIQYETFKKSEFEKIEVNKRCTNCQNILNNK